MNIPNLYIEQITVEALKIKLTSHCGTTANSMELQLKDESGRVLATLDDGRMLGYYSPKDGCAPLVCPGHPTCCRVNRYPVIFVSCTQRQHIC